MDEFYFGFKTFRVPVKIGKLDRHIGPTVKLSCINEISIRSNGTTSLLVKGVGTKVRGPWWLGGPLEVDRNVFIAFKPNYSKTK